MGQLLMELLLLILMQLLMDILMDILQAIHTDPLVYHLMAPHPTYLLTVPRPMYLLMLPHLLHLKELRPHLLTGLLMNPLKDRLKEPLPQLIEPQLLGENLKIESYSLSNQMVIMQLVIT